MSHFCLDFSETLVIISASAFGPQRFGLCSISAIKLMFKLSPHLTIVTASTPWLLSYVKKFGRQDVMPALTALSLPSDLPGLSSPFSTWIPHFSPMLKFNRDTSRSKESGSVGFGS
ncbi:hypothetical protein DVH24_002417 [Malus domestica]|uniref:Uncharacterized protein n=1 Tax=Malus domestica TaxID=3750 RepID=A0A498IKG0_MALDO|nr:hypothetical protein DVH24_002417 [Malus domestica]